MIEKGSRERIEIERKRQKGNELKNFKRTSTLASACCSASSRHWVPRLDSALKRCSSEL